MENVSRGRRLFLLRKEAGLSQRQLGAAMGVPPSRVSAFEQDWHTWSPKDREPLAEALGVSLKVVDEQLGPFTDERPLPLRRRASSSRPQTSLQTVWEFCRDRGIVLPSDQQRKLSWWVARAAARDNLPVGWGGAPSTRYERPTYPVDCIEQIARLLGFLI